MADLADLFRRLTAGVYVVGVADGGRRNAFTAAWLMQVSFDPLLLALSINPGHASFPLLVGGDGFAVSVLSCDQLDLARHFGTRSGRETDKLAGVCLARRPHRRADPCRGGRLSGVPSYRARPRRRPRDRHRPPGRGRDPPSRRDPPHLRRHRGPGRQPRAVPAFAVVDFPAPRSTYR